MITNEQIQELEAKINEKTSAARLEELERRKQIVALTSLKFGRRQVEDKAAVYKEEPDPEDDAKTIKILVRAATLKVVFDVPPMSRDDPTEELEEDIRAKRFNEINALY